MRKTALLFACCVAAGCAAEPEERPDAIDDFIKVNQLERVSQIRSFEQLDLTVLNDYYVLVSSRFKPYLISYGRRCTEGPTGRVAPDYRRDPRVLQSRVDTLRGCRIDAIYLLDETQVEEIKQIRPNPGE